MIPQAPTRDSGARVMIPDTQGRGHGPGGSPGSQGPLHLPSDDLPRVDREKAPEGRPGPGKLQGDPATGPIPSYAKQGE